jgi:hypothetical protein
MQQYYFNLTKTASFQILSDSSYHQTLYTRNTENVVNKSRKKKLQKILVTGPFRGRESKQPSPPPLAV